MSTVIQTLKHVVNRGRSPQRYYECRRCGTTVETAGDTCPACGAESIACYRLG